MKKTMTVTVGSVEKAARDVVEAWHRAEQGKTLAGPRSEILFTDLETLLRMLTPQRFRLLRQLHRVGPCSIRSLAKALGRDYKNVHQDVAELRRLGLVEKNDRNQILVPWDVIDAHLDLAAA